MQKLLFWFNLKHILIQVINYCPKRVFVTIQTVKDPFEINNNWLNFYNDDIDNDRKFNSFLILSDVDTLEEANEDEEQRREFTDFDFVIDDCLDNVLNPFKFDNYLEEIPEFSEKSFKVHLQELNDSGYFMEKFQLNFYERNDDELLTLVGGRVT